MPMHRKYAISCQVGGSARPSQIMVWISTPIAAMPATDAAIDCM